MITFATICPHPPILIPSIGGDETARVQSTLRAMRRLGRELVEKDIETIVIVSPHGPVSTDAMSLNPGPRLSGGFSDFQSDISMTFECDTQLAARLKEAADARQLPLTLNEGVLDHGTLVPLFFLALDHPRVKVCSLSISWLDYRTHFAFGRMLGETIRSTDRRIALVASGDLSHRLTREAPAGYSPRGQEFDDALIRLLETDDSGAILRFDPELVDSAGECGLRPIIMLLGALDGTGAKFEQLSYEGPFGVGYLVGTYNL